MPTLNTNFTGSGIETTTPTVGPYGSGGSELDMLGLSPELSKLLRTRIATAQANANTSMHDAQNAEMGKGPGGTPIHRTLGGAAQDPAIGRMQASQQAQRQAEDEARAATQNQQAQQIMLARQAQSAQQNASSVMPGKEKPYRLGGTLIDPTLGVDASEYLTFNGYGPGIAGRIMSSKG